MVTNVDGFEIERDGEVVLISFHDIFAVGETYEFTLEDARAIRDALSQVLGPAGIV